MALIDYTLKIKCPLIWRRLSSTLIIQPWLMMLSADPLVIIIQIDFLVVDVKYIV